MNENFDLTDILKDCPRETTLYSIVHGEVSFISISTTGISYPISVRLRDNTEECFTAGGKLYQFRDGECILFPSRDQRDWSKFSAPWYKKEKFNPKTLKPFDKVLVRDNRLRYWVVQLFSHIIEGELNYPYLCVNNSYKYCIPYNDDTKHLVGTTEEAPEFYRY